MRRNPLNAQKQYIEQMAIRKAKTANDRAISVEGEGSFVEAGIVDETTGELQMFGLLDLTPLDDGNGFLLA